MKKRLIALLTGLLCLSSITACTKGIEKEYSMEIKELYTAYITSDVQEETHDLTVAYCKRGMSLFNYYIEVPEWPEIIPAKLVAKETGSKTYFHIEIDGKDEKVTDHGYKFIKWGE